MIFDDRGFNIPEPFDTLWEQQRQLVDGRRSAQMFPVNSSELPLPEGCERVATDRGVFHFNPAKVTKDDVCRLSSSRRENELLGLGPFNKADVFERVNAGEDILVVTERTPDGIEVKAAAGTKSTMPVQVEFLERTKSPGNVVAVEHLLAVLDRRLVAKERA